LTSHSKRPLLALSYWLLSFLPTFLLYYKAPCASRSPCLSGHDLTNWRPILSPSFSLYRRCKCVTLPPFLYCQLYSSFLEPLFRSFASGLTRSRRTSISFQPIFPPPFFCCSIVSVILKESALCTPPFPAHHLLFPLIARPGSTVLPLSFLLRASSCAFPFSLCSLMAGIAVLCFLLLI